MNKTWGWHHTATALLAVALVGSNIYTLNRAGRLERELSGTNAVLRQEISGLKDSAATNARAQLTSFDQLRAQFEDAQGKSATELKKANAAAQRHASMLVKQLADAEQQREEAVLTKIGEVRQETENANTKVTGLASDVTSVRSEVAQTKTTLDDTIATLRSVRGDLGVQSGLIATNAQELAALRALGERNYVEFDLSKGKTAQKIGNILVQVKKVDVKRNRFTIDVVADDKRVEKRDRTVNEPIQFYIAQSRMPLEIVVNQVKKDQIVGYLSTPKVHLARQ